MLFISPRIRISDDELRFSFTRSSGPGGQNVNKVNTKAVLRWAVQASPSLPDDVRQRFMARYGRRLTVAGEIVINSQRFREQGQNQRDCLEKLRNSSPPWPLHPSGENRPARPKLPTSAAAPKSRPTR